MVRTVKVGRGELLWPPPRESRIKREFQQGWRTVTASGGHKGRAGADAAMVASLAGGARSPIVHDLRVSANVRSPGDWRTLTSWRRSSRQERRCCVVQPPVCPQVRPRRWTLIELMAAAIPPSIRLGAAKGLLEYGMRHRAEQDLSVRLAAIEKHLSIGGEM